MTRDRGAIMNSILRWWCYGKCVVDVQNGTGLEWLLLLYFGELNFVESLNRTSRKDFRRDLRHSKIFQGVLGDFRASGTSMRAAGKLHDFTWVLWMVAWWFYRFQEASVEFIKSQHSVFHLWRNAPVGQSLLLSFHSYSLRASTALCPVERGVYQ